MREIEFVPEWYLAHNRQKRLVRLHVYVVFTLLLALATWGLVRAQAVEVAEDRLAAKQLLLDASSSRVRERQTQQQLRDQLQLQERVDRSLGVNVESSRLLVLIDQAMPPHSALVEVTINTDERQLNLTQIAAGRNAKRTADRRMSVVLKGVAPTNTDVAAMYEKLEKHPFCEELNLKYARPRTDDGHVMCEFVIEFSINLNAEERAT